jgi:caffeoyl-CoA O-methyltransferase
MRISAFAAAILCLAPIAPAGEPMTDRDIEAWLPRLLEPGQGYANIEPAEGAYLRSLVVKVGAKRALELGTSTGYSGIWIAMGLRQTGGRLTTIEIDRGRHASAVENFKAAGLAGLIDARLADALRETAKVEGPLDFVFIDALKPDYLKYYEMVLPKMRRGGVITAHNVVSNRRDMAGFLERIQSDPKVRSEIVTPGWQGISVSFVK